MNLRIAATYAATDGAMPETVEVTFEEIDQDGAFDVDLQPIIAQLLAAPSQRSTLAARVSGPRCLRGPCGHAQSQHGDRSSDGYEFPERNQGPCTVCDDSEKCRSFVGAPIQGYLLINTAERGEILGLCRDGAVRNVGASDATQFDMSGAAADNFPAGSKLVMRSGQWVRR